jgi:dimethylhistidine N-methyltransferase
MNPEQSEFLADVLGGLQRSPKTLPGKYLWDETGSILFDHICGSPDYYPTRRETALLRENAKDIAEIVGERPIVVEFGSGASHKIRILLDSLHEPCRYVAVDISGEYLATATARLAADYPGLEITPVVADYTKPLSLPIEQGVGNLLAFFPGSTIGTFNPGETVAFLARIRAAMGPSWLLLGADPNQDPASLARAYGDQAGLMAALHTNVLARIGRELGGKIDPADFRHEARLFNDPPRVEAHLVARRAAEAQLGGHAISFEAGESIRTDFSYKYAPGTLRDLAREAGWRPVHCWLDPKGLFSLHLLTAD